MEHLLKISTITKKLPDPLVAGIKPVLAFIHERAYYNFDLYSKILAAIMSEMRACIDKLSDDSETNLVITHLSGVVFEDNIPRDGYLLVIVGRARASKDFGYTTMYYLPTDGDDNITGIEQNVEE
jgi:hypothetical protein